MKHKVLWTFSRCFAAIVLLLGLSAQTVAQDMIADSIPAKYGTQSRAAIIGTSVAAGFLIADGGFGRVAMADPGNNSQMTVHKSTAADIFQFVPVTFSWIAKACGVKTRSSWGRMAVSQVFGGFLEEGIVWTSKHTIKARRPDSDEQNSFPSGHTARAFFGATAGAIEYGESAPVLALIGYGYAAGIGVQRVMSGRHFPVDVVAGAGIGIVAAEAGYLLGDLIFGKQRPDSHAGEFDTCDRFRLGVATGLDFATNTVDVGGAKVRFLPSLRTSVDGQLFFGGNWGLAMSANLAARPTRVFDTYYGTLNSLGLSVGPTYRLPLGGNGINLGFTLQGGYGLYLNRNFCEALSAKIGTWEGRLQAELVLPLTQRLACKAALGYGLMGSTYITPTAQRSAVVGMVATAVSAVMSF